MFLDYIKFYLKNRTKPLYSKVSPTIIRFAVLMLFFGGFSFILFNKLQNNGTILTKFIAITEILKNDSYISQSEEKNIILKKYNYNLSLISKRLSEETGLLEKRRKEIGYKILDYSIQFGNFDTKPGNFFPADINGDGIPEIVLRQTYKTDDSRCQDCTNIIVFSVKNDKLRQLYTIRDTRDYRISSLKILDLNRDGRKEVVINYWNGGSSGYGYSEILYWNNGKFRITDSKSISRYKVNFIDFNKDGIYEIEAARDFSDQKQTCRYSTIKLLFDWKRDHFDYSSGSKRNAFYNHSEIPALRKEVSKTNQKNNEFLLFDHFLSMEKLRLYKCMSNNSFDKWQNFVTAVISDKHLIPFSFVKDYDKNGMTGNFLEIHRVCETGNQKRLIKILNNNPELINKRDQTGCTPLYIAVFFENKPLVKELLDRKANINLENIAGFTPLHQAVITGQKDIAAALIYAGADIHKTNAEGYSPIDYAAIMGFDNIYAMLEMRGARFVNFALLDYLASNNRTAMVEKLLIRGADPQGSGGAGLSPIHLAAKNGNAKMLKMLIRHKAIVNTEDQKYSTPLHYAANYGNLETVQILIENGAIINTKNIYGVTPLNSALFAGKIKIARYLIRKGAVSDIFTASAMGDLKSIKKAVKKYPGVVNMSKNNNDYDDTITPLILACKYGRTGAIKMLLQNGARISYKIRSYDPEPIDLQYARESKNKKAVMIITNKINNDKFSKKHLSGK